VASNRASDRDDETPRKPRSATDPRPRDPLESEITPIPLCADEQQRVEKLERARIRALTSWTKRRSAPLWRRRIRADCSELGNGRKPRLVKAGQGVKDVNRRNVLASLFADLPPPPSSSPTRVGIPRHETHPLTIAANVGGRVIRVAVRSRRSSRVVRSRFFLRAISAINSASEVRSRCHCRVADQQASREIRHFGGSFRVSGRSLGRGSRDRSIHLRIFLIRSVLPRARGAFAEDFRIPHD